MGALKVNSKNFEEEVLKSDIPVLVDICADWCLQCRVVDPVIDDLAEAYAKKFKIAKMNYNDNKTTAEKYNIKWIPTLLIFVNGQEVERLEEVDPEDDLKAVLDKYLKKKAKKSKKT